MRTVIIAVPLVPARAPARELYRNLGSLSPLHAGLLSPILASANLARRTGYTSVTLYIKGRSLSRTVWEWLPSGPTTIHVLAVFERACNLVASDGHVIGVVLPDVGDGPLNIVVGGESGVFASLEPGMPARLDRGRMRAGALEIDLADAQVWEPCPDWEVLRTEGDAIRDHLPLLEASALRHAPASSLLVLTSGHSAGSGPTDSAYSSVRATASEATVLLQVGWRGDETQLRAGAARLAGLGSGLTPSGDDFLFGVMMWAWLAHPDPTMLRRVLLDASAPRTTTLSAALLGAAARGECSAAWHLLLAALAQGNDSDLDAAARDVLARGATSGADALAGFLWAGSTCTLAPI